MLRRLVPQLLVPLAIVASVLAADPWLRAFPVNVGAVPFLGAAVLSVLIPALTLRVGARLWVSAIIDVVALGVYLLFVVLHDPSGFEQIVTGLRRGPSQILTFALPLVSPRDLMVGPVALIWVAGAVAGECFARRWATVLPFLGLLASFGLAYAATQRAATGDATSIRLRETLLAGGLLVTLLLLRAAQSWVRQNDSAESTQADGVLPLRGFGIGVVTAVVVSVAASLAVQSSVFPKQATAPQRQPRIDASQPLAPLQFVASLRPQSPADKPVSLFGVHLDATAPGYFGIANLDYYDGAGWSFERTFRPSGGVLPADADPALNSSLQQVSQDYTIKPGVLTTAPWIPTLYRAERVTGTTVDIDETSGMIVPAHGLRDGGSYTVISNIAPTTFGMIDARRAAADTSTAATNVQVPPSLRVTLDTLIANFVTQTQVPRQPALPFLQALQTLLRTDYSLSGAARGAASGTRSPEPSSSSATRSTSKSASKSASRSGSKSPARSSTSSSAPRSGQAASEGPLAAPAKSATSSVVRSPSGTRRPSGASGSSTPSASGDPSGSTDTSELAGGTGFADVVASLLGQQRAGTPEQFATLTALMARELGIPARVVTGFRVLHNGSAMLPAGNYDVYGAEAWTWVEVPIVGRGWVPLDATPSAYSDQTRSPDSGTSQTQTPTSSGSQAQITQSSSGGHAVASAVDPPQLASAKSGNGLLAALLLVGGALVLVLLLVLLSRKQLRRARRRRAPDPRLRLLGAWQESLDMLTEAGLPELRTLTSAEVADLTAEQFGAATGEQTALLGGAANAVAYSSATAVEDNDVAQAWATERTLRRSVRKQLSVGARTAAAIRYHRRARGRPLPGPGSWAVEAAARAAADTPGRSRGRQYRGRRRR